MVIFSVLVGYYYLEEDRENIFHCDALPQRSVFCLKKCILGMEMVVKKLYKSVKEEEEWKRKEFSGFR